MAYFIVPYTYLLIPIFTPIGHNYMYLTIAFMFYLGKIEFENYSFTIFFIVFVFREIIK